MSQPERRYSVRTLIVAAFIAMVITVVTLEMSGRIDHSGSKTDVPVGEFKAIHLNPGGDGVRMSPKSSELHAVCEQGYLAIASDVDPAFRGILVDYKNRGVRCGDTPTVVANPSSSEPHQ